MQEGRPLWPSVNILKDIDFSVADAKTDILRTDSKKFGHYSHIHGQE